MRARGLCGALVALALAALGLAAGSCGYHVSGHADAVPKSVHTIAIPAFKNATASYRLTQELPGAITREMIARTRYRIVPGPDGADAVLSGIVLKYETFPITSANGRATSVQMSVHLAITLRDSKGAVLYNRPDFEVKERYEIAVDPRAYLDESDAAADRICRDVARMVVSGVLENF